MIFKIFNNWKGPHMFLRNIELIPSICLNFNRDWSFDSIRVSWLGIMIAIAVPLK